MNVRVLAGQGTSLHRLQEGLGGSLGGYPSAGSANSSGVSHSQMRLTKDINIRLFVARHLPAKEYWLLPCLPAAIGGDVIVNDILLLSARNLFMEG